MKMIIPLMLLVLALPVQAQEVTFGYKAPEKGDRVRRENSMKMDLTIEVKMNGELLQKVEQKVDSTETSTIVMEETGETSRASIVYGRCEQVTTSQGQKQTMREPVSEKAYVVTRAGAEGDLAVAAKEEGAEVAAGEAEKVKKDMRNLGKKEPFARLMDGKTVKVGESVEITPETASELFEEQDENTEVTDVKMSLKALTKVNGVDCAELDLSISFRNSAPANGMVTDMVFKGSVIIETKTLTPRSLKMKGPLTVSQAETGENGVEISGGGEVEMEMLWTCDKAE